MCVSFKMNLLIEKTDPKLFLNKFYGKKEGE